MLFWFLIMKQSTKYSDLHYYVTSLDPCDRMQMKASSTRLIEYTCWARSLAVCLVFTQVSKCKQLSCILWFCLCVCLTTITLYQVLLSTRTLNMPSPFLASQNSRQADLYSKHSIFMGSLQNQVSDFSPFALTIISSDSPLLFTSNITNCTFNIPLTSSCIRHFTT